MNTRTRCLQYCTCTSSPTNCRWSTADCFIKDFDSSEMKICHEPRSYCQLSAQRRIYALVLVKDTEQKRLSSIVIEFSASRVSEGVRFEILKLDLIRRLSSWFGKPDVFQCLLYCKYAKVQVVIRMHGIYIETSRLAIKNELSVLENRNIKQLASASKLFE
jgi:hypothetical protein